MSTVSNPHSSPYSRAITWLVRAQFAQVWDAANQTRGVIPGPETIPGMSHPDVGKKFDALDDEVADTVKDLVYERVKFFRSLVVSGKLRIWIDVGAGRCEFPEGMREELAYGLHLGWKQNRINRKLSGHKGDIGWNHPNYDPAWKESDRTLVDKWAVLLHYCESGGPDGTLEDLKFFVSDLFNG